MNTNRRVVTVLVVLVIVLAGALAYALILKPSVSEKGQATSSEEVAELPIAKPVKTTETAPVAATSAFYNGDGFKFEYPTKTFAAVAVTDKVSPPYKTDYTGIKLIATAAVSTLGKQECSYGQSGKIDVCTAEMQRGIAFFKIDVSASTLVSALDPYAGKTTVTLAGKQTVKWSIGAEGEGADYYFVPLTSSKTLVIIRYYDTEGFPQQALFDQVIATLVLK